MRRAKRRALPSRVVWSIDVADAVDEKAPMRASTPTSPSRWITLPALMVHRPWWYCGESTTTKRSVRSVVVDVIASPYVCMCTCQPPFMPLCAAKNEKWSQVEHLVLMVNHHDPVGSHTDRMLGMVIVDTATALQAPGISTQEWFPVRKGPGMKAGDVPQGKVHVKVRVSARFFDPPKKPQKQWKPLTHD